MMHNELKRWEKSILAGQMLKSTFFEIFFRLEGPRRKPEVQKKFQKTLISFEANTYLKLDFFQVLANCVIYSLAEALFIIFKSIALSGK